MTGSNRPESPFEKGFTFVELMFGVAIIAVVAMFMISHLATTYRSTHANRDRVFAYSTAQSILDEVQSLANGAADPETFDLLNFDDGALSKPTLSVASVAGVLVPPDHPISRNILRNGRWLWSRLISVKPMPGAVNRSQRYVTVTVYKRDGAGIERSVASLSAVVNAAAKAFPATQVYDLYLLALESIPGWWVNMESIQPFVESTIRDLETRNPGLEFRTHWITKASYGRNPVYRPYLNVTADTEQNIPEAYFYAGRMPAGGAINFYYSPERFRARIATDVGQLNGYDANLNPYPYAVSDFYNHAMRLPQERLLHTQRVAEVRQRKLDIRNAILAGMPPPAPLLDMSEEPTLRLLLEDMSSDPDAYRHAVVINLHGELVPLPALRNYSDAAKLPRSLPEVRVVTHPEQLRTERPTVTLPGEDVVLRVYAYTTDPNTYPGTPVMDSATHTIAIEIPGLDLTDGGGPELRADVGIENLPGGVVVGGTDEYFPFAPAKHLSDPTLLADEMAYTAQFVDDGPGQEKRTVIWLHNTPVVAPQISGRGIWDTERSQLYRLEYIPSCTEAAGDFSRDLYTPGTGPKNTARWAITIPKTVFADNRFVDNNGSYHDPNADFTLAVRTRIWDLGMGDPSSGGVMYPVATDPENLSVTYTWWADSREDVPVTERSQFLGDPRHNPYKDLVDGDPDFPSGYNWYHDALDNNGEDSVADYPGLDAARLENRWDDLVRADIPRLFGLYRGGLVGGSAVYTSLTGWSYYYAGIGNDMGADVNNGYPDSLPMNLRPFGQPGNTGFLNNIIKNEGGSSTGGRRFIMDGQPVPDYWWGMPWLGELYPDRVYDSQWIAVDGDGEIRGNLLAGTGNDEFKRVVEDTVHAGTRFSGYGTSLLRSEQRTAGMGCTAYFNIGLSTNTFHHSGTNGQTGDLVAAGIELGTNYGLTLPPTTEISRPFELAAGGGTGPEFGFSPHSTDRFSGSLFRTYYDHQSGRIGSGAVELTDPGNTTSAFIIVNGLNPTVDVGTSEIAKYSILSTLHTFFEVGETTLAHRIPQTPRAAISWPTEITELPNPATIDVQFDIEWLRWDGLKYTTLTAPGFTEDETRIEYVMLYSRNNGQTWSHMDDNTPATPGQKPANPALLEPDAALGPETYTWNVPSGTFPEGSYTMRVEAYRDTQNLHYAYHQVRCFIDR